MTLDGSGDVLGSISHDSTVRLWDIAYLRELRHMHEDKRDDDDSEDEDEEEEEEEEQQQEEQEDGEEEEEDEVAFQPRKKVKPLTQGRAAIKMGADFFSGM